MKDIKQGGYKISAPEPTLTYYSNVAPEMQSSSSQVSYTMPAYKETKLKRNKLAAKKRTKTMDYKNNRYGLKNQTAVTNRNKFHRGCDCKKLINPAKRVAHNVNKHTKQIAYKQVKPLNDYPNKKVTYKVVNAKKYTKHAKQSGYKTTVSMTIIDYTSNVAPIIGTLTPVRTPEPTSTAVRTLNKSYASLVETPASNLEPVVTQLSENGASYENLAESEKFALSENENGASSF